MLRIASATLACSDTAAASGSHRSRTLMSDLPAAHCLTWKPSSPMVPVRGIGAMWRLGHYAPYAAGVKGNGQRILIPPISVLGGPFLGGRALLSLRDDGFGFDLHQHLGGDKTRHSHHGGGGADVAE